MGLWALAALAPLVAVYVFHRRSRRREVSSLLLWDAMVRPASGHTSVQRPPLPITLLLEILAIVIMALGLADLRGRFGVVSEAPVVIVDNSLSMSAVDLGGDGRSALDRARESLRAIVAREGEARIILAGASPQLLGTATPATFERVCEAWRADAPTADIPSAFAAALQMSGGVPRIAVITDGPPSDAGIDSDAHPELRWIGVGRAAQNGAIVDAARSDGRIAMDLRAFASTPMQATVQLLSGSDADAMVPISSREVEIAPTAIVSLFAEPPAEDEIVEIRLGHDALAFDNSVHLVSEVRAPVRVRVQVGDPDLRAAVHSGLAATGRAEIVSTGAELVIADSGGDPSPGARTVRILGSPDPEHAEGRRSFAGPFVLQRDHSLVEGIDLTGVIWAIPIGGASPDPESLPLILADTSQVFSVDADGDLSVRIDIGASTVTKSPAWPSLWWNILRWRDEQRPGLLRANAPLGQPVRFVRVDPALPVVVIRPDGSRAEVPVAGGVATIASDQLGIHAIEHGPDRWLLAIQPTRLSESDLQARQSCDFGKWPDATEERGYRSLAWLWSLLAMGVLGLHSWLLRDRRAIQ